MLIHPIRSAINTQFDVVNIYLDACIPITSNKLYTQFDVVSTQVTVYNNQLYPIQNTKLCVLNIHFCDYNIHIHLS